jgi:hypothetical protein
MVLVLVLAALGLGALALGALDARGQAVGASPGTAGAVVEESPAPRVPDPSPAPPSPPPVDRPSGLPQVGEDLAPAIGATDWWSVVQILDGRRARALQAADAGALGSYAAASSPASMADEALITDLVDTGLRPVGLGARLVAIEVAGACPDAASACLEVVDRRSAYRMVDSAGEVVEEVPEAASSRWRISLVPHATTDGSDPGWRFSEVVPAR